MTDDDIMVTLSVWQWEAIVGDLAQSPDPRVRAAGEEIAGCLPDPQLEVVVVAEAKLTGEKVRDVMLRFKDGFTMDELAAELEQPKVAVARFVAPMKLSGVVVEVGKMGRTPIYGFVKPGGKTPARPTKSPAERDKPAYTEARATGMPVRIVTERKDRRGRSTPGQRQKILNRDRNYERMQEAIEKRMAEQKKDAQKPPKWQRKKKK